MTTASSLPICLFLSQDDRVSSEITAIIGYLREVCAHELEVHIAGFAGFDRQFAPDTTFHTIRGRTTIDKFLDDGDPALIYPETLPLPPSGLLIKGREAQTVKQRSKCVEVALAGDPTEYVRTAIDIEGLIARLDPVCIACDPGFWPARDAVSRLGRELVLIAPGGLRGVAKPAPGLDMGIYPSVMSSTTYPVPWYLRPFDAVASLKQAYLLSDITPAFIAFSKSRNEAGYPGNTPNLMRDKEYLVSGSLPELDYPFKFDPAIAPRVTIAGPIIPRRPPVAESHPELAEWLRRRPTVLIESRQKPAISRHKLDGYWAAIQMILDARMDLQVLWRLEDCDIVDGYSRRKEFGDRLKIYRPLDPRSMPMLLHAEVQCLVGASHFNLEIAARTGTPLVALTGFDGHGKLVEWLGIGEWGDKNCTPRLDGAELGRAVLRVVGDRPGASSAGKYRQRAAELSRAVLSANGGVEGRVVAGEVIRRLSARRILDRVTSNSEGRKGDPDTRARKQWPSAEEEKRLFQDS